MSAAPSWADEEAIREELFSVERLEQHAESLAAAQSISAQPERGQPFAQRVRDNDEALLEAYRVIACLLYTSPSPRDGLLSRMPSSA